MTVFLQYHVLTVYPPSNPNRDDQGRPKEANIGGARRQRLSSQSIKRAIRESSYFAQDLAGNLGTRTKRLFDELHKKMIAEGAEAEPAQAAADAMAGIFGKLEVPDKKAAPNAKRNTTLAFISPDEWALAEELCRLHLAGDALPKEKELRTRVLRKADGAVDIALFGRMLADDPEFNRDAAVQVSHAFTTHGIADDEDWFSAVDDLNQRDEATGAGHLGEFGFGSGVYYLYACLTTDLLTENLAGDRALAARGAASFTQALALASPGGKRNSFAHNPRASFLRIERGTQQPRDLSGAFFKPIQAGDMLRASIEALHSNREAIDRAYGACCDASLEMDVNAGQGSLDELVQFAAGSFDV